MNDNIIILLFYSILLTLLSVLYIKKAKHSNGVMSTVLVTYTISAFFSLLYYIIDPFKGNKAISISLLLYWIAVFVISCVPLIYFDKSNYVKVFYKFRFIKWICIFSLIVGIIPFFEYLTHVNDFVNAKDLAVTLSDIHDDNFKSLNLSSISNFCVSVQGYFYYIVLLSIVPIFKDGNSGFLAKAGVVLNISNRIIPSFIMSSRGAILLTIIELLVVTLIYYPTLNSISKKRIRKTSFYFVVSVGFLFVLLTVMRQHIYEYNRGNYYTLPYFVSRYAGEGLVNFTTNLQDLRGTIGGDECFWYAKYLLGLDPPEITRQWSWNLSNTLGVPRGIFYTYIGNFVMDIGFDLTILFWGVLAFLIICYFKWTDFSSLKMSTLLVFLVYSEILLNGFYLYRFVGMGTLGFRPIILQYILLKVFKQ